jgi:hypothetical protein
MICIARYFSSISYNNGGLFICNVYSRLKTIHLCLSPESVLILGTIVPILGTVYALLFTVTYHAVISTALFCSVPTAVTRRKGSTIRPLIRFRSEYRQYSLVQQRCSAFNRKWGFRTRVALARTTERHRITAVSHDVFRSRSRETTEKKQHYQNSFHSSSLIHSFL